MNEQEWIEKLKSEGFDKINVVDLKPNFTPGEHTHDEATTHVILKGELVIKDENGERVFKAGDRVDFPAGTRHSASFGNEGCKMIVGIVGKTSKIT